MSKTTIRCTLDTVDINRAIKEIKQFERDFLKKCDTFVAKLAEIGLREASVRFTTAMYDGINDSDVWLDTIPNGFSIIAKGNAVLFIEFGSGVYHNPGEPYPEPRPNGVVGIGEYGQGKGKRRAWYYKGEPGSNGEVQKNGIVKTRGNPAAMPMWYASEEMKNSVLRLAKEVFR
jgi:hypothetical protein